MEKSKIFFKEIFIWSSNEIKTVIFGLGLSIVWVFHCSGLTHVLRKFIPLDDNVKYPSGMLWVVTIYLAIFGLSDQLYQNEFNFLQSKIETIRSGLVNNPKYWMPRIPRLQGNATRIKPKLESPLITINSFRGKVDQNPIIIDDLIKLVESFIPNLNKKKLKGLDLDSIALPGANLPNAFFQEAILTAANFQGAKLERADFFEALLNDANFKYAQLRYANFSEASLTSTNFEGANLKGAKFRRAILLQSNLKGAQELTCKQISDAIINMGLDILFNDPKLNDKINIYELNREKGKIFVDFGRFLLASGIGLKDTVFPENLNISKIGDHSFKCEEVKKASP